MHLSTIHFTGISRIPSIHIPPCSRLSPLKTHPDTQRCTLPQHTTPTWSHSACIQTAWCLTYSNDTLILTNGRNRVGSTNAFWGECILEACEEIITIGIKAFDIIIHDDLRGGNHWGMNVLKLSYQRVPTWNLL